MLHHSIQLQNIFLSGIKVFPFYFFLHTATQLVRVSNDLPPLQYFYISQSTYLQIQASEAPIFTLFVLFLSALSNIIVHLDDTEVLYRN